MPENQPLIPALLDSHGRRATYLRVSVTDRCNLCCRYCRDEKTPFIPHDDILRYEEIERIIGVATALGVRKIRFTGGEPFARKGFLDFLKRIRAQYPDIVLKLTTNGTMLESALEDLKDMGVSVNLSLDSLDRQRYAAITGRDLLPLVLKNMTRMVELGIPLKINAVAVRGINDGELRDLASLAMDNPVDVRFIEFMPMGEGSIWTSDLFWPAADILKTAGTFWTLEKNSTEGTGKDRTPSSNAEERGPATLWKLKDKDGRISRGSFGLITSVTQTFCASCNRLRLTAEGNLRTCLYDDHEYPLRDLLRSRGVDAVRRAMLEAIAEKPIGSEILSEREGPVARKRMSAIGG